MKTLLLLERWLVDVIVETKQYRDSRSFLDGNRSTANGELIAYRDVKRKVRKLIKESKK